MTVGNDNQRRESGNEGDNDQNKSLVDSLGPSEHVSPRAGTCVRYMIPLVSSTNKLIYVGNGQQYYQDKSNSNTFFTRGRRRRGSRELHDVLGSGQLQA